MKRAALIAFILLAACGGDKEPKVEDAQSGRAAEHSAEGEFFAVDSKPDDGELLITLPAPDEDGVMLRAIHASGLTAGLGSNPVG
ncbi:MAG: hypothetical protein RIE56_01710, partial [Amphiplicatus sp.]